MESECAINRSMRSLRSYYWAILLIGSCARQVLAQDSTPAPSETEAVTVTGEAIGSLTSASPEQSANQKTQVPGAFTVRTNDDMELGRASNFEDLLQRTPGVFLQSENGTEVSKI